MTVTQEEQITEAPATADVRHDEQPEWLAQELPEQYAEIAQKIATLREEARTYERVAAVLWHTGSSLTSAVRDLFTAIGFEAELSEYGTNYDVRVSLGNGRRMLIDVVSEQQSLDRKSPHIARILKVLQEDAGEKDRVVLAANIHPHVPPAARRGEPVSVDAMRLIQGLGANFVPTSALFGLWKASLADGDHAKNCVLRLYSMDGGIFR
jgi:hypothetical protein